MGSKMQKIKDIDKRFVYQDTKSVGELNSLIQREFDFYASDGEKVVLFLKTYKDYLYFESINKDKFEVFRMDSKNDLYSYGCFQKNELIEVGKILREFSDKKVNINVVNCYL
jgi:hypothetical protein